jgi:hypothetical protein
MLIFIYMKRTCLKTLFIVTAFLSLFITQVVLAASLSLTHIGSLATNGSTYSEWWYSGTNPLLKGTAADSAEVMITIDSEEYTTNADSSGMWSYQTTLSSKDYSIVISSEGEQYSFTLHAGQSMSGSTSGTQETTQSTSSVPPTGHNQIAGIITALTLVGAGVYAYTEGRKNTKEAYVDEVMKDLD